MKKILSLVAMLVMSLTAMAQAGTISNNGVTITEANGWLESAYIKFNLVSSACFAYNRKDIRTTTAHEWRPIANVYTNFLH